MNANDWINAVRSLGRKKEAAKAFDRPSRLLHEIGRLAHGWGRHEGRRDEREAVLRFLEGFREGIRTDQKAGKARGCEEEAVVTLIHAIREGNHVPTKGGG